MKHRTLVASGLVIYLLGLLATAPPTLIDAALERVSDGKVRLAEATGSLWSGAGQVEMRNAGGHSALSQRLVWRLLPESLLRGHLIAEIQIDQAIRPFPLTLTLSPTRIELANVDISMPATDLGVFVARLAPLGLSGDIAVHIGNLSIEREQVFGRVTLQLRNAGSPLSPVAPLGDYEFNFDGEGSTVRVLLRTMRGPLQLDGNGSWATGGSGSSGDNVKSGENAGFHATAHVPARHEQQLAPLLRLIAQERGAGSFELETR
jgi:general secretion pathway protein N